MQWGVRVVLFGAASMLLLPLAFALFGLDLFDTPSFSPVPENSLFVDWTFPSAGARPSYQECADFAFLQRFSDIVLEGSIYSIKSSNIASSRDGLNILTEVTFLVSDIKKGSFDKQALVFTLSGGCIDNNCQRWSEGIDVSQFHEEARFRMYLSEQAGVLSPVCGYRSFASVQDSVV